MSESGSKLTELSSLGEFGLIEHLTKNIPIVNKSTVKGIGDDAAVLKPASGSQVLVSKDLLIEGVHFDLMYMPLKHLGYKAAVVNFSDIVAMNGVPKQIVVGISVSSKYTVEALEEIYAGIKKACDVYKVDFVGGDTTSSANPDMQPDLSDHDYILERQLKPEARTDLVKLFSDEEIVPTSMIDISDGLASEALHICKASDKGCLIYEEKIPVDQDTYDTAREFGIVPTVAALNGGEDYELLFTIKQNDYDKIKDSQDITVIGYITEKAEGEKLVTTDNHVFDLKAQGWDALKKRDLGDLTSNTKKS